MEVKIKRYRNITEDTLGIIIITYFVTIIYIKNNFIDKCCLDINTDSSNPLFTGESI